jgi:Co/Zn/Cd efflux system component
MEGTPLHVDLPSLESDLREQVAGVAAVHSLRVWSLKAETLACTVHIVPAAVAGEQQLQLAQAVHHRLATVHQIQFATVQVFMKIIFLIIKITLSI